MSYINPSSLTTEEYQSLVDLFTETGIAGDVNTDEVLALLQDMSSLPEGVSADDLLAFYLSLEQDLSLLSPDDPMYADLWEDESVQSMLNEVRLLNMSTSELEALMAQISDILNSSGLETDVINTAQDLIEQAIAEGVDVNSASQDFSDQLENLATIMKSFKPQGYLLMYIYYYLGPATSDINSEALEAKDEMIEERGDLVDELADLYSDVQDNPELNGEIKRIETALDTIKESERYLDEIIKINFDTLNSALETVSSLQRREQDAMAAIRRAIA